MLNSCKIEVVISLWFKECWTMANFDKTMKFNYDELPKDNVETILNNVYKTLEERGYNAVNQIVGYLLSGDPAYIPRHNEARNQIRHIDRDDIMEELVSYYLKNHSKDDHA